MWVMVVGEGGGRGRRDREREASDNPLLNQHAFSLKRRHPREERKRPNGSPKIGSFSRRGFSLSGRGVAAPDASRPHSKSFNHLERG